MRTSNGTPASTFLLQQAAPMRQPTCHCNQLAGCVYVPCWLYRTRHCHECLLQPSSWPSTAETKSHSHRWILNRLLGDREASRTTARLCTRLEHFACGSCYGSRGASDQAPLHDQVPGTLCRSMMGHMRLQILMYQYSVT